MNKPTLEQLEKIHKLHKRYLVRVALLTFLYLTGLFLGNIVIAMIGLAYIKNPLFTSSTSFGATIIVLIGLRFEVEKAYSKMKSDVDRISKGTNQ